uniref:CBM20 domain-containing protein n=1 Tax=Chromera velia CCMP2878 TaxID=1169474 RepID=A0A0G4HQE2_9ALVE|eukprot:Cvel_30142.t1-p1 / transcript=Cvel_30142.t1 / gene=Cvel_30142 / organism=Chromera_velia_CCMP2878 / gene_product=Zinc finger protein 571, putative / transcript_product=Zinc finger protein 571, putative / location=Cvel_scaffold4254:2799-4765(+) / protein_length=374 / sequence_SO=supercontig / SO=protein_coding / is_pseudo=false
MKGLIAFVAQCPEVRENQRVVVAEECAELGGWELGDALSLTPAPCGRPWWVSSEVEVNLSESTMGVSGDFVNGVGAGGESGGVGVSELKFRLLAIPNDGDGTEVPDPDNPVCLEPLRGGDFRIIRLVGGLPPAEVSSVREKGDNTIHVCEQRGREKMEMVGISVEWGVPESVQLALLPLHTKEQSETENPHRESDSEQHHGSAGGALCVSMGDSVTGARTAEERAFVSMVGSALGARSAEGGVSVCMVAFAHSARIAEVRAFVSTVASARTVRSVGGKAFVSTADSATVARSAGVQASVSTADAAQRARSAGVQAFVSTADTTTTARPVEVGAAVFTEMTADAALSASLSLLLPIDRFEPFPSLGLARHAVSID